MCWLGTLGLLRPVRPVGRRKEKGAEIRYTSPCCAEALWPSGDGCGWTPGSAIVRGGRGQIWLARGLGGRQGPLRKWHWQNTSSGPGGQRGPDGSKGQGPDWRAEGRASGAPVAAVIISGTEGSPSAGWRRVHAWRRRGTHRGAGLEELGLRSVGTLATQRRTGPAGRESGQRGCRQAFVALNSGC